MTELPLKDLRVEIDEIDREIIALLKKRLNTVERVIATKKEHGLPVRIDERIRAVIDGREALAQQMGIAEGFVRSVYETIVEQDLSVRRTANGLITSKAC